MTSSPAPLPLEHSRFAVVDVETTGGRAQRGGRILEVAVAILEAGTVPLAFTSLLDPRTPIPPPVARPTRITHRMGVRWPRLADVGPHLGHALDARVVVRPKA